LSGAERFELLDIVDSEQVISELEYTLEFVRDRVHLQWISSFSRVRAAFLFPDSPSEDTYLHQIGIPGENKMIRNKLVYDVWGIRIVRLHERLHEQLT
jgi:hypothetical protein